MSHVVWVSDDHNDKNETLKDMKNDELEAFTKFFLVLFIVLFMRAVGVNVVVLLHWKNKKKSEQKKNWHI